MLLETTEIIAPPRPDKPLTVLRKAHLRLCSHGWVQGRLHCGEGFCLLGAVAWRPNYTNGDPLLQGGEPEDLAYQYLANAAGVHIEELVSWNDHPERTKEQVIAVAEKAIEKRRADLAERGDA